MAHQWQLRCPTPTGLVWPVEVGSENGPSRSAARFGNWRQVGSGLYVPTGTDDSRVEQRILEKSCLVRGAVVTGWAALRLHGSNLCDGLAADGRTPLDIPLVGSQSARPHEGVSYSRANIADDETTLVHGIRCATALRATGDAMCAAEDLRAAVIVGDIACSAGLVSRTQLVLHLHTRGRTPGLVTARSAAELVSDRSRSPAETKLRLIWLLDAGLPVPLCNWPVLTLAGQWMGAPDLLSTHLGIYGEYDGEDHRDSPQQATDAARDTAFQDLGMEGFRVVGRDLHDVALVVARIRSAARRAAESQRPRLWRPGTRPRPLFQ